MKKIFIYILMIVMCFTLTACGNDEKEELSNKEEVKEQDNKNHPLKEEENNSQVVIDDEIIDIEDEDNTSQNVEGTITVSEVINCPGCVYAYFDTEGDAAKRIGDTLSPSEYTTDINNLKKGQKQRHNFFGLVLSGNTISKAYACILKDSKIYCIEGSVNGAYHNSNIAILNQIFTGSQCRTISDGHTYTCTDGSYNGDTKTNGYTSLHYETSCTIYGGDSGNAGKLICH